jgi:hypothetical protein
MGLNGQGRESNHGGSEESGVEHHFGENVGSGWRCVVEVVCEDGEAKAFC